MRRAILLLAVAILIIRCAATAEEEREERRRTRPNRTLANAIDDVARGGAADAFRVRVEWSRGGRMVSAEMYGSSAAIWNDERAFRVTAAGIVGVARALREASDLSALRALRCQTATAGAQRPRFSTRSRNVQASGGVTLMRPSRMSRSTSFSMNFRATSAALEPCTPSFTAASM